MAKLKDQLPAKYKVIRYRNINSDGSTLTDEKVITARTVISAKQQASALFPVKGRWDINGAGQYVKGTAQYIGGDKLFVVPL